MNLASYQKQILQLLKSTDPPLTEDSYLLQVYQSKELALVQEIVLWWRAYQLEQYCKLTTTLLKKQHQFEEQVTNFYRQQDVSSYIEQLSDTFLSFVIQSDDGLLRSVASFEQALIRVKKGDTSVYEVNWPYEPYAVLGYLLHGTYPNWEQTAGNYQTFISHKLPHSFYAVREAGSNNSLIADKISCIF